MPDNRIIATLMIVSIVSFGGNPTIPRRSVTSTKKKERTNESPMFLPRPTLESKQLISGDVVGRDADLMARLTPRYVQISPDAVGMERKLRTRELLRETIRFLPSPDGFRAGEIYLESFRVED